MWIKICGVTTVDDASMIAAAGADAIGLNFYAESKRCVGIDQALAIRKEIGDVLDVVGVFVNATAREVADVAQKTDLTAVQFHGDETVQTVAEFHRLAPRTAILRAFRVGSAGTDSMTAAVEQLAAEKVPLAAVLVDALVTGEYGGTGHRVDGGLLQDRPADWPRLILAGGLTPETVTAAVAIVQPWGVDTASGVESAPGIKCRQKVEQFIATLRPRRDHTGPRLR